MEYILKTENLTKKYKNFKALDNVNLKVPACSIYGLIGKNGAGKSTLIRIITSLETPTSGSYSLFNTKFDSKEIYQIRERVNALLDKPSLILNMTAYENLTLEYLTVGLPSLDGINDLLDLVGLSNVKNKKVKTFSLGMKQRLGIALSLVSNPDFILLDEPINGLDPEGIISIRELILKLNKKKHITILISSHYLDELSKIATHYGFLDKGKLIKEISANELNNLTQKKTELKVTNIKEAVKYFEQNNISYEVIDNTSLVIFDKINISEFILYLSKHNTELKEIKNTEETLENYYINLMGENND